MIDLHTHILPGLDDGSPDLDTSVLMAAVAVESGVTHLVVTPHSNQRGAFENYASPELHVRFECLREAVCAAGLPLELSLGMEIFGTGDVPRLLRDGWLLTLNGGRYLLIEFGFHEDPLRIERLLDELLAAGYWPVVAHPERYYGLQRMPNYLFDWVNRGIVLQVNKGSLFGRFGRGAQALAGAMLAHGLVGCVASDAHGPDVRTPDLSGAWDYLAERYSEELAQCLLEDNPARILRSEPLPEGRFRPFF